MSIPGYVYRNLGRSNWDRHFRRNAGTSDQSKNAGGLTLIRNQQVLDSISAYELQWARAEYWRESYLYNQREIYQLHEFINNLFRQKRFTGQDANVYRNISVSASQLIELIKKEYLFE